MCYFCCVTGSRRRTAVRTSILIALLALSGALVHVARSAAADAHWIVFAASTGGGVPEQLYRVQTTGAGLQQITTGSKPATDPAFSPDGGKIVFARLGSGIFRVNLDGSALKRLTSGTRDTYPVWSRDGKRIAFLRPFKKEWRLFMVSAAGGAQKRLGGAPPAGRPSWTANSKSLVIPAEGSLAKVDSRTGKVQKIYNVTLDPTLSQAATLSPNSTRVAFVGKREPTGPPDCGESMCPAYALYVGGLSGSPKRVARDTGPAGWSPDGKSIVFASHGGLDIATALGANVRPIVSGGAPVVSGTAPPAWQP
jgi:Tol biopolymer transport system component